MFEDYQFEWDPQKDEATSLAVGLSPSAPGPSGMTRGESAITSATNQRPVGSSSQGSDHASTCLQW